MAQGRMLSTKIAIDKELNQLSLEAEFLYLRCIPHLDRDGLISGDSDLLIAQVAPRRFAQMMTIAEMAIAEWIDRGLVLAYDTRLGRVLFFTGFQKNQTIRYEREAPSVFDVPPGYVRTAEGLTQEQVPTYSGLTPDEVPTKSPLNGKERKEKEEEEPTATDHRTEMVCQYEAVLGMVPTASYPEMIGYMDKLQARDVVDWWPQALTETTGAKRPGWQYMKAILESWLAAGQPTARHNNGTDPSKRAGVPPIKTPAEQAEADRRQAAYEAEVVAELARATKAKR